VLIEIGKTYEVTPSWKKSYEELEIFEHEVTKQCIGVRTLWRAGTVRIVPQNEDEVNMLHDAVEHDDGDIFEPQDLFEEVEFCDCWDGVSEDLEFYGDANPDEVAIREQYDEGDDFVSDLMEKFGYYPTDLEVFMHNQLDIEEVEPNSY
tara:strand:- start:2126 stop:2572 length:447 start_codon:yes stop_codon:yes gene_type:complete